MALTQESILSFLLEHGGKVKNSELLNNFRSQINCSDPAEKLHNRDLFKKIVNSVAVVKQIDEVKFVVVKKRYQDFIKDVPQKTHIDDSFSSSNTSFSYTSPPRAEAARIHYSDIENNNTGCAQSINGNYYGDAKHVSVGSMQKRKPLSRSISSADATTVKVLNLSGDNASRAGRSGAVFAVISVKSPPRDPAPAARDRLHSPVHQHKTSHTPVKLGTKVSTQSLQNLNSNFPACKDALSQHQWQESTERETMQPPGFPQVRPQNKTTKQADDAKYSDSVPLEPLAHEWLVKCAAGLWSQIYALLLQDSRLAQKKDFMSGFTALHWATKEGNSEMIHKLMAVSRQRGTYININGKTNGGYTPLHIAAIHGHTDVMLLLVQSYEANVNERDHAGKKAFHYLGEGVPAEIRALLGGQQENRFREKADEEDYRVQSKGFNTISKLFQPHMGKKQKTAPKITHDW